MASFSHGWVRSSDSSNEDVLSDEKKGLVVEATGSFDSSSHSAIVTGSTPETSPLQQALGLKRNFPVDRWSNAGSISGPPLYSPTTLQPNWTVHDQRDTSQHSRGSIWTDDHSRNTHTTSFNAYRTESDFNNSFGSLSLGGGGGSSHYQVSHQLPHAPNAYLAPSTNVSESFYSSLARQPDTATQMPSGTSPESFYGNVSVASSVPSLVRGASSGSSTTTHPLAWSQSTPALSHAAAAAATATTSAQGRKQQPIQPPPGFRSETTTTSQGVGPPGSFQSQLSEPPSPLPSLRPNSMRASGKPRNQRNRSTGGTFKKSGQTQILKEYNAPHSSLADREDKDATSRMAQLEQEFPSSSIAIQQLLKPTQSQISGSISAAGTGGGRPAGGLEMDSLHSGNSGGTDSLSILPKQPPIMVDDYSYEDDETEDFPLENEDEEAWDVRTNPYAGGSPKTKKQDWLLRMSRKLQEIPEGEMDPSVVPISAIMNAWAKTKSAQGASMVETWLKRAQREYDLGNHNVIPTTKLYTMAVDAWARSGEGGAAAQRAEALLQRMHQLYQSGDHKELKPTTGIFNAVINAWARSKEKIAPARAEQILDWMENLRDLDVQPDKYTFNTVIHSYAKAGGTEAATKAQELLTRMHKIYQEGNVLAKPDTITYNVVINCWAKSGGKGAATEAEKLLARMHRLHEMGDPDVKPNVVTYGAVIDSFAKSGERGAASRADTLLAKMIQLHQSDPIKHADLLPNTYVFNTVINCWAKSKETDAASKAEEMLVAMSRLHASGMPSLKPDAFTYTAVIDAWAKSGYRGAAARADQLLDKMEAKYQAGDMDLKPNTFTYNAVINALAKSGEAGAAARAERVLQNMVNRHRNGGGDDVKPTTINFNTVLDAWAKSGGGRAAAERAEEILEWMDRLHKQGNSDVKPDTITFNAVLDAWARSSDRMAPRRAEQILDHMDELYRAGNKGVKPDTYTYNTLINAWAKSGERGSAARAEHVLSVMEQRFHDGDKDFKPNTRTHTSVIDAWAKSGEKGAARRAEQILNNMIARFEATGDVDVKPNVHTANAVCNTCAFSKNEEDRAEALQIAFRVFDWLSTQTDMDPDSYTYTILLSVCANLLPRDDTATRYDNARAFFESCRDTGYVNDFVLRKLRQTVGEDDYVGLVRYAPDVSACSMPSSWTRHAKVGGPSKGGGSRRSGGSHGGGGGGSSSNHSNWSNRNRRNKGL